jgi:hypothetical protein
MELIQIIPWKNDRGYCFSLCPNWPAQSAQAQPLGLVAHSQTGNTGGAAIHGAQAVEVDGAGERWRNEGRYPVLRKLRQTGSPFWPSGEEESHCAWCSMVVSCWADGTPIVAWTEGRGGH